MRICFFGDSYTNGTGDDGALGWVGRLAARTRSQGVDLTLYNLGVRRDTSQDIKVRWRQEAEVRLPIGIDGRLVFAFGNNDTAFDDAEQRLRLTIDQTLNNTNEILAAASSWLPTLMIGPIPATGSDPHDARIRELSGRFAELCQRHSVPFMPLSPLPPTVQTVWRKEAEAGDGVHPNAEGYASLARHIEQWNAWQDWFD